MDPNQNTIKQIEDLLIGKQFTFQCNSIYLKEKLLVTFKVTSLNPLDYTKQIYNYVKAYVTITAIKKINGEPLNISHIQDLPKLTSSIDITTFLNRLVAQQEIPEWVHINSSTGTDRYPWGFNVITKVIKAAQGQVDNDEMTKKLGILFNGKSMNVDVDSEKFSVQITKTLFKDKMCFVRVKLPDNITIQNCRSNILLMQMTKQLDSKLKYLNITGITFKFQVTGTFNFL